MNSNRMEFNQDTSEAKKRAAAKKRVAELKGFYVHLSIYIVINFLLLLKALGVFENGPINLHMPSWSYFTTPFFWGLWVLGHGLYVFNIKMFTKWEERKIQEYLEKEEREYNNFK